MEEKLIKNNSVNGVEEVSDKELLTFCNLAKLKLEHADLGIKRVQETQEIITYHTIYTLIKELISSEEKRKDLGIERSDEIRKVIPVVMEYYDRYPGNKESKFLDEWELLYSGDSYEINKTLFSDMIFSVEDSKISKERKDTLIENIPTRIYLKKKREREEKITSIITFAEYIDIMLSVAGQNGVSIALNKTNYKSFRRLAKINDKAGEYNRGLTLANIIAYICQRWFKEEFSEDEKKKIEETEKILKSMKLEKKNFFEELGIKIVFLRKGDEYVIVVEDTIELADIDTELNDGTIPKKSGYLLKIYNYLIKKYDIKNRNKVIKTGFRRAGKLVTLLEVMTRENPDEKIINVRPFYLSKPLNLGTIVDFSGKDIAEVVEGYSYLSNWELIVKEDIGKEIAILGMQVMWGLFKVGRVVVTGELALLILFAPKIVNVLKERHAKKLLEKYIDLLIKEGIIEGKTEDKSEKIIGKVNIKTFNNLYQINGINLNLETYLQVKAYEIIEGYRITENEKEKDEKLEEGKSEIKLTKFIRYVGDSNDISSSKGEVLYGYILLEIKNNEVISVTKYNKTKKIDYTGSSLKEEWSELEIVPEDSIDSMGRFTYALLQLFSQIQANYTAINQKAFYIENDEIKKLDKLELEVKKEITTEYEIEIRRGSNVTSIPYVTGKEAGPHDYMKIKPRKTEYYYLPYVSEGGEIGDNVRKEYIGSFLKSTYATNTKDYDLGLEIEKASELHCFETTKKGDEINTLLYSRMKEKGEYFPHYKNVLKQVGGNTKILEDYYHIEVKRKDGKVKNSQVKIGLLDSNKLFDKNKIAYSYNLSDKIKPKLIERKVFYPTSMIDEEEELPIAVIDKAILKCSEGSCPLELKVLSQKFKKTNNLLDATVLDYIGNKSIIPKGTLCNKNLINGVPQMCSGYISTNEWEQGSKGITLNG
ncbi:MAG: hypothetical protein ACRC6K_01360, partial [Fusobacteriaceae bacterium]